MDVSEKTYESVLNTIKYDLKQDKVCGEFPPLQYNTFNIWAISLWRNKLEHSDLALFNEYVFWEKINIFAKEIEEMITESSSIPVLFKPQLKEIVDVIQNEIEMFLEDQVQILYYKYSDTLKIYWDNICWTDQSTINKVKTIEQIIDNASMSTIEKYILACNYCLEDKIDYLLKLLPENFIDSFEDNEKLHLFFFWTLFKRGEINRFSKYSKGMKTFTYILTWAISRNMETAVQNIWEKFNDRIVKIEVLDEISDPGEVNPNIAFYILQNMNEIFEAKLCEELYCSGLSKLHSISRWCNIVPLTKYFSELNSEIFTVTKAFIVASFCWHKKFFDVEQFSLLWNDISIKFELTLKENFNDVFKEVFYNYEYSNEDIHIERLLLGMCTLENKKSLINGSNVNFKISRLIVNNGMHLFDILFKEFFDSEMESELFKRIIFNQCSLSTCRKFIILGDYERLHEYLIKFCPEGKISKFKNEFYLYDGLIMTSISYKGYFRTDPLTNINRFLNWSFEGNDEKINQFKAKVYDLESSEYSIIHSNFFKEFQKLLNENDWELVEKYWNWIFYATEKKNLTMEEKFARIKMIFRVLFRSKEFYLGTIKYCTIFKMIISLF